ncbi:MAG: hypothetical protein R3C46_04390 [Hyphomonadaceae bacterium]
MRLRVACLAAVLAAAACSPEPETEPAETPATGAEAPAAKRMPLPDCGEVEAQDVGADGWKHPDCRLMLPDQSGLAIEARYTPAEDESTQLIVQVVAPGDATLQELVERMGNTFNSPSVKDVDGDGKADILLPLETGNVNTTWAFWRQIDGQAFVRVGEPNGVSILKTDSGYIAVQGRSSAAEYFVDFYKLEGDDLKPVVTARVAAQSEEDGKVTSVDCLLDDAGGLASTGLSADAARQQFCAEPYVDGLVKDLSPAE